MRVSSFTLASGHAASDVTLYHYPLSRSVRPLIALHEAEIPFHLRTIQLMKGEAYSDEFLKLNPNHAVPVLTLRLVKDGDSQEVVMFESAAILRFIADVLAPPRVRLAPSLARGDSPHVVAEFERLFAFATTTMDQVLTQFRVLHHLRGGAETELLQTWVDKWNDEIVPQLEAHFSARRDGYASPSGFTILDCVFLVNLIWAKRFARDGLVKPVGEATEAYRRRAAQRPSWRRAVADAALLEKDGSPSDRRRVALLAKARRGTGKF